MLRDMSRIGASAADPKGRRCSRLAPVSRKDISMTADEVGHFLAAAHTMQVATLGPDGWPHVTPMWFVLNGDGLVEFRSFTKSQKIRNLTRNPRVTLLAESGTEYGELRGVMIKGLAALSADRATVLDTYGRVASKYGLLGEAEPTAEVIEAALGRFADKNTSVLVTPTSVASWDHTKLGGAY